MARAILILDNELQRDYKIQDERVITLKLEEDYSQISFFDSAGEQLGLDMDFVFTESETKNDMYLLSRMFVPIRNSGLGRAALEFFIDKTDATIYARSHDGLVRDDGSHLTEDAPAFVTKMQEEGLIQDENIEVDLGEKEDY